jgi:hypothetical protein
VTVCVAAVAEKNTLIGVSDRMLTAGDVEFEPAQAKMWIFSSAVFALISGDTTIQAEILSKVDHEVKRRIAAQPDVWVSVKEIAELYCKRYRELLRSRAEAAILYPLGLDLPSFLARQSKLNADLVVSVSEKLTVYDFESPLATLFIGNDHDGPDEKGTYAHLYATEGDKLSDYTPVGFAAIGIGKFHAESQFMFSGHWPSKPFHETLLLAYAAKKRAEVAPGVGRDTDMVVIGPSLGFSLKVEDKHIAGLERIYQKSRTSGMRAINTAVSETKNFLEKVREEYATREKSISEPATQSADPKDVPKSKPSRSHSSRDR